MLKGTVTALRGSYREQMNLTAQLLARNRSLAPRPRATTGGPLQNVRLVLRLATLEDISAENNYGRVDAGAALRVGGTVGNPTLAGRISLRPGGLVFLGGNTYRLERGSIDFREGSRIEPVLDITARTQVGTYNIQLQVDGPPDAVRADLTSDPPVDQSDIVSLLMTGRTVADGGLTTHVREQPGPGLLFLDEPYSGFDWETYLRFREHAQAWRAAGRGILVVAHLVFDRSALDRVLTLSEGRLRCA